ncbi:hypothetical protein [Sinorhizobium meliloti]|uniref:PIN-like domain-containing protein n=1 Tax=Rhizobium meliloti TaxID=382 RepID=UPI000FD81FEF|nr:hypothetical protein [Sinorhizobium meliloti]RVG20316.1 hypothetical protein CN231_05770 [Sinorhizobium meliloti]
MKIKFDENISRHIVDAIRCLETDKTVLVESVFEDYGAGTSDPDWMFKFREEGGVGMISGDHRILQDPVNLIPYTESGLVSIWPDTGWPVLKRFGQAALIARWWPCIKARIQESQAGQRWRLPMLWTPEVTKFKELKDPRL